MNIKAVSNIMSYVKLLCPKWKTTSIGKRLNGDFMTKWMMSHS